MSAAEYETIGYQISDAKWGTDELLKRLKMFHPEMAPPIQAAPEPETELAPKEEEPAQINPEEWLSLHREHPTAPDQYSPVTVRDIKYAVCKYFGITPSVMASKRKTNDLVYARQIGFYLAREKTGASLTWIGRYFGGRDHTTVYYGAEKVEKLISRDSKLAHDVAWVERMVERG